MKIAGTVVGVLFAIVTALGEAFLVPLHWGTVRVPLAVVLAVLTNWAALWFTYQVTRSKGLSLVPGFVWMAMMVALSGGTSEGDIVLASDNWVGIVTLFAGVGAFTLFAYRLITQPPPPPARETSEDTEPAVTSESSTVGTPQPPREV